MLFKTIPKQLLGLYFLLLIGGCGQGNRLEMNQSPKRLSPAIDRWKALVELLLPKIATEPRCHTEICMAIPLAQDRNYTAIYDRLVEVIAPALEQDHEGWVAYKKLPKWNTKPIIYSTHAKNRAQERGISYEAIKGLINNPTVEKRTSKKYNHILQLVANELCVVVAIEQTKIIVITTYLNTP